jgi:hypothetical protein
VAGNSASTSASVNLDKTPPTIAAAVSPAPNAAGWNKSAVTVTYSCSDALSGVATCPQAQTIASEGANQNASGTATDIAGNTANSSTTINLDETPPSLTITSPANGSTIALSATSISLTGTAGDSLSGIATISCNGVAASMSGQNFVCLVSLAQGANSILVQATDVAGNSTSSTLTLNYAAAPQIAITSPVNLSVTNLSPVKVNGTVNDPAATVTVNGIAAPQSSGGFSIPVPLVEGLNTLTAVATNASGVASTATVQITLDTTPPHITIDSPAAGLVTTDSNVTVTGLANDVVVGTVNAQDVQVTVNGIAAQVGNRTYAASGVPLTVGQNTIQAIAHDRAGNGTTTSVAITRVLPSQPPAPAIGAAVLTQSLAVISGNNQTNIAGTQLSAPLVVTLKNSSNNPVVNQTVVFKVTGNDGFLNASSSGGSSSAVAVNTDVNGQAQVFWTLGKRAGAGINTVQVSSALAISPASFTATGVTGGAAAIVVDSGNGQVGVVGQQLPFPFVADVIDVGHNRVPNVPVTFTVKRSDSSFAGSSSQTVQTDSNGRAIAVLMLGTQTGNDNSVVEASFSGNQGLPAAFAASARVPGSPANTTISGVLLDNSNNPIQGVTLRLYQTNQGNANNLPVQVAPSVQTDAKGTFLIPSAPVGSFKLMADGTTATSAGSYPTLEYDIVTVAGNDNNVGMPIYLPALDTVNKLCVDETHGGTLTLPQVPGFALTVAPGSATFPGGSRQGCVSVTPVNGDKVPMSPGFGQQPRFIVTIQPVGTKFDPPAAMTLPNVDGLSPRSVTEMYSYDHDLGMFVAIGTGTVSADGSVIKSNPGVGVLKAGWHCGGNPNQMGSAGTCPECQTCSGSGCVVNFNQIGQPCSTGLCCGGSCQNATVSIDINNTPTNTDDITVLNPVQDVLAQVTLHMLGSCPVHVDLSAMPPGRVTLSDAALDLTNGAPGVIKIVPEAVSLSPNDVTITASVNGKVLGTAHMTVVDVNIPAIKNKDTPPGVTDRIPPRVNTPITVTVNPDLGSSGQAIHLVAKNNNPTNGDFTIGGSASQDITTTTAVQLQGTVQTAPSTPVILDAINACTNSPSGGGNAQKLNLVAQVGGQDAVTSSGFSVTAIPLSWAESILTPPVNTSQYLGFITHTSVLSDSGQNADLDQVCVNEQVQQITATGTLAAPPRFGEYATAKTDLVDRMLTPKTEVTSPGGLEVDNQTHIFEDFRTGATNIPVADSGYVMNFLVFFDPLFNNGTWRLISSKQAAATSANTFASGAGIMIDSNGQRTTNPVSITQP